MAYRLLEAGADGLAAEKLAQVLADVGDVTRFADRGRFASWTGAAPLAASSAEND